MMKIPLRVAHSRRAHAVCLSLIIGLAWSSPAQAQVLSGRAFAAFINTPTLSTGPLSLADTGDLAPDGGWNAADLLTTQLPSIFSANTLVAATVGQVGKVSSSTSLADVVVLPGHVAELAATFVRSEATTTDTGSRGSTEIYNLSFGGAAVAVTGLPNQKVEIPGMLGPVATLIINEQAAMATGITVNALHLVLATGDEVIVSSAKSTIDSAPGMADSGSTGILPVSNSLASPILPLGSSDTDRVASIGPVSTLGFAVFPEQQLPIILATDQQPSFDFVTGGGFFFGSSDADQAGTNKRINFGFNAGVKNQGQGPVKVGFNLVDQNSGRRFQVQAGSLYAPGGFHGDETRCREFRGPDRFTGATVFVQVCDFRDPGRKLDKIAVAVPDEDYFAHIDPDTTINGGNNQLHQACPQEGCPNSAAFDQSGKRLRKVWI